MSIKSNEFINKAKEILENFNTVYMWGVFGAPVTENLINSKVSQYPNWYSSTKQSRFKSLIGKKYFGFDCVNLIKAILWGWSGDSSSIYGGAVYPTSTQVMAGNVIPDTSANGLIGICTSVSTNFSKIIPGEAVWMDGHIGIYIGDGKVIECTTAWNNKVQISALGNIGTIEGLHSRVWTKHGKIPWVIYEEEKEEKLKRTWPQILNSVSDYPKDWTTAVTTIIDAVDDAELGKLEIFHYFGTLIEKIDMSAYSGKLTWIQIIDKVASRSDEWKVAINAAVGAASAKGNFGVLEVFKYIPELIVKIYESKK